jgi:hypothetical protein
MSAGETFDPNCTPADPVAEALDLFARMPVIIGREPDSEIATVYEDIAAMMGREGVLDGLDWNDARSAVAAMAYDIMERGPDHLLIRAGWMRAEVHNGGPLNEPVRVAEAVERLYNLLVPVPAS